MAWLSDLAGKAEHFLDNLDEQTGAALRNHHVRPKKFERYPSQNTKRSPAKTSSKRLAIESTTFTQPRQSATHVTEVSPPIDLEILAIEKKTNKLEKLETRNAELQNELHIINHEVSDLLEKLRLTEDGNDVDSSSEALKLTKTKLLMKEQLGNDSDENGYLSSQIFELKDLVTKLISGEDMKYRKELQKLASQNMALKELNTTSEKEIKELNQKLLDKEKSHMKLENEMRHAQSKVNELQNEVEYMKKECKRLEEDWEGYKVRVKGMLHAKDSEIKALREGIDMNEDCKVLSKQVEGLKEERQELTDIIDRVHKENAEMNKYVQQIESKNSGIDRTVTALRETLKEEHQARSQVETQFTVLQREMQSLRFETGQTIAALRAALHDKDIEIKNLKSVSRSSDTSALNVGDYSRETEASIDNDKVRYLTHILCQRQERIDALLAENNIMKIQMVKLESKLKSLSSANTRVINVQEEPRPRPRSNLESPITSLLLRAGIMMKRYPVVRLFMAFYLIGLHFCVLSILMANTPDNYSSRLSKS